MLLILKGFLIGVAKVIPGVSGSLIALNLGLYERLIGSINHFFKDIKNNSVFLFKISLGIILAIIFGSRILNILLDSHYLTIINIFIGLLLGTNVNFIKKNFNIKKMHITVIVFILMISLFLLKSNSEYIYQNDFGNNIYVILLGFIDAATMIIPSVSGTAIFMFLGTYKFILKLFSNPFSNINILFLFMLGIFLGVIFISKLMNYLLKNKKEFIYHIIIGLFLSSITYMIVNVININNLIYSVIIITIFYKISIRYF